MKYQIFAITAALAGTFAATNSIDDEAAKYEQYRANDFALRRICLSYPWAERGNIPACTGYGLNDYVPGVPLDDARWHQLWAAWELSRGTNGGILYEISKKLNEFNQGDTVWFNWNNWRDQAENNFAVNATTGRTYYTGTTFSFENNPEIILQAADKPEGSNGWIPIAEANYQHGDVQEGIWFERFNNRLGHLDYVLGRNLILRDIKFDGERYSLSSLENIVQGAPANDGLFFDLSKCPNNE